jgi:hypothetical protein
LVFSKGAKWHNTDILAIFLSKFGCLPPWVTILGDTPWGVSHLKKIILAIFEEKL